MAELDTHYWEHVEGAEVLVAALATLAGENSPQALSRRQVLALELLAIEAHIERELYEAASLAVGHRVRAII